MAEGKVAAVRIPLKRTSGLPPEGVYRCVIRKVDLKDGPSNYQYMSCECGIDDKTQPVYSGRTFYANLSLSPKATWKMEEALDALGAPEEGEINDTAWFHGKRFYAKLVHNEYEGRTNLQLERWIARDKVQDELAAWKEKAAEIEAEEKATKEAAQKVAAELAPDVEDEDLVAEPDEPEDVPMDEALDDLWDD